MHRTRPGDSKFTAAGRQIVSAALTHNMLRVLWEIGEGKTHYNVHHSATLDALYARGLIETPLQSGRWCGAVTPAGQAVLDAAPSDVNRESGGREG